MARMQEQQEYGLMDGLKALRKTIGDKFEKIFRRRALRREFDNPKVHVYDEDLIWFIDRQILNRGKKIKTFQASRNGRMWKIKIN